VPPHDTIVRNAELEVADTVGHLMHFWGFKRRMGRMWALLYLSPDPLGAADIAERLRMSAGSVSMTLADLLEWGAIKRTWRPGERREFYEPETSIWKLLQRVLRERELALVRQTREALEAADAALDRAGGPRGSKDVEFKRARIATLRKLARIGEGLLTSLDAGRALNPAAKIREVVSGGAR
jgi:HTH-type transcriptional regulator, glycine betaine synthesis regulator